MTKKEISKLVYSDTGLNQTEAQQAVQSTFASLTKLLLKYGRVELRGFGVFEIKTRAERKARNPRTGEEVQGETRAQSQGWRREESRQNRGQSGQEGL